MASEGDLRRSADLAELRLSIVGQHCIGLPDERVERLLSTAGSTGRRNTFHPYRQRFEIEGLPATWLNDDPRLYKYE